jgi:hypothetical protein
MPCYCSKCSFLFALAYLMVVLILNIWIVNKTRRAPPKLLSPRFNLKMRAPLHRSHALFCFLRFLVCVLVLLLDAVTCDSSALIGSVERGHTSRLKFKTFEKKPEPCLYFGSQPRYRAGGVVSNRTSACLVTYLSPLKHEVIHAYMCIVKQHM